MKKRNLRKIIVYGFLWMMLLFSLAACGSEQTGKDEESSQTEQDGDNTEDSSLFLIVENDTMEEGLMLYSYATGLEHYYEYSFSTQFKDKYGNFSPASEFTPGRVVTIGKQDKDGYLTQVQLASEVWEYEDVHRFSVDEEQGILNIAGTKYSIRDKVYVFSNGERISFMDISEEDILTVIGKERKILSVVVTTGHGTLSLINTTLFEGSYLQLNRDIFILISDSMEIEVPEGTYTLKVANDGWGGTTEIEVVRGETTEVDLDTLKGEGKKRGIVHFEIDVEDVAVYIDSEKVDHTQSVELTYGTHVLQIEASGYDTWKKYLFVNSQEATISIELSEDEEAETTETETTETEASDTESAETENTETESTETLAKETEETN